LLEINENLMEMQEIIENSLADALDEFNEKIETGISRFDEYNTSLDHFKNLLELTGRKSAAAETLISITEAMNKVSEKKLKINIGAYKEILEAQ
jgi:hypothetical protein